MKPGGKASGFNKASAAELAVSVRVIALEAAVVKQHSLLFLILFQEKTQNPVLTVVPEP
jgi:hypothetical protein